MDLKSIIDFLNNGWRWYWQAVNTYWPIGSQLKIVPGGKWTSRTENMPFFYPSGTDTSFRNEVIQDTLLGVSLTLLIV